MISINILNIKKEDADLTADLLKKATEDGKIEIIKGIIEIISQCLLLFLISIFKLC